MPIYEYKCHSCGETFEVLQKFSDEPLKTHVECGGAVERLVSTSAFHFKGTGWYVTDYAKKGNGKSAPGRNGKDKDKAEAPAAKSESGTTTSTATADSSKSSESTKAEKTRDRR